MNAANLRTPEQIVAERPLFTLKQLRYQLHRRADNGLEKAVMMKGSRFLIDLELFDRWIMGKRSQTATPSTDSPRQRVQRLKELALSIGAEELVALQATHPDARGESVAQILARWTSRAGAILD